MEFSSAGRAMVANGIPGLKRLRLRHRPALVRDDGDGFLTNLHGQLVDCPFARAGNDRDVVSANAGTHTPCRSFWSTLVDDFRSNDSLWLWVPHRASLVRDDGGGFSHMSFQTATREHSCSVIASASEAIHRNTTHGAGLLRCARNDGCGDGAQTPNVVFPDVQLHIVDAPLGAGPESITTMGVMDSGLDAAHRPGMTAELARDPYAVLLVWRDAVR